MVPPIHHRFALAAFVVVPAVIIALVLIDSHSQDPTPEAALQTLEHNIASHAGFAGYAERRPTTSVSASWVVPRASSTVAVANASDSTWVSVQNVDGAFIQVGTVWLPIDFARVNQYEAFWSSTQLGFHPKRLISVFPGDRVTASISQAPDGWEVAIHDLTTNAKSDFVTRYSANDLMDDATWSQEDPVTIRQGVFFNDPYPQLTPVNFINPRDDGAPLEKALLRDEIMATSNGYIFEPHLSSQGNIEIRAGNHDQWRYLRAADTVNVGLEALAHGAANPSSEMWLVVDAAPAVADLVRHFITTVEHEPWPDSTKRFLPGFVRAQSALAAQIDTFSLASPSNARAEWRLVQEAGVTAHASSVRIRTTLGLPATS
jgi:hypothetical protein